MVLFDGKKLAERLLDDLKNEIAKKRKKLRLGVIVIGDDPVIQNFIQQKKKMAESVGIDVRIYPFDDTITTNELRKQISAITHEEKNTGVIIQLPLPPHINKQYILNAIPAEKDVDVLSARAIGNFVVGKSILVPPVVGAVRALFEKYEIGYHDKRVVVAGAGNLVGRPLAWWLLQEDVSFSIITVEEKHPEQSLQSADIIISGIGIPGFITGDMIKEGAVIIDAGTSESAGKVVGDVDTDSVGQKPSYLAPVPGGVGPLTIVMLFQNLLKIANRV